MTGIRTSVYAASSASLKDVEAALTSIRAEGAADDATVTIILGGAGPLFKAEWSQDEPDHAPAPADTREQPVQAAPAVQPDGIVNEPGQ